MGWAEPRTVRTRSGVDIVIRTGEEDDAPAMLAHLTAFTGTAEFGITEIDELDLDEAKSGRGSEACASRITPSCWPPFMTSASSAC